MLGCFRLLGDLLNNKKNHHWMIYYDELLDQSQAWVVLNDNEREKSQRFRFEKDRKRYIFFHAALRFILAQYCDTRPQDIDFVYNSLYKPFLKTNVHNLQFSFSHSDDLAICGLSSAPFFGVDLEHVDPKIDIEVCANAFFSDKEKKDLQHLARQEKVFGFYSIWTAKEAFGKAIGEGITYPLEKISIPVSLSYKQKDTFIGLDKRDWQLERYYYWDEEPYVIACVFDSLSSGTNWFIYNPCRLEEKNYV